MLKDAILGQILDEQTQNFPWTAADLVDVLAAQNAEQAAIEFIGLE